MILTRKVLVFLGGSHASYSAIWELDVSGAFMHWEFSVSPDNLVEIECSGIQ